MESAWLALVNPGFPLTVPGRGGYVLKIRDATICSGKDFTMFSTLKFSSELMTEPRNLCSLSPSTPNAHLGLKFRGILTFFAKDREL
ncbi:hypothetical protein V6N11_030551 [Hibiscus sabdariffa]|uniref:Uncharacterized protein n=1 Tax=Hibiscus sabdariffa TaxID=183260 RepID=A0ABR2N7C3_9ROSI